MAAAPLKQQQQIRPAHSSKSSSSSRSDQWDERGKILEYTSEQQAVSLASAAAACFLFRWSVIGPADQAKSSVVHHPSSREELRSSVPATLPATLPGTNNRVTPGKVQFQYFRSSHWLLEGNNIFFMHYSYSIRRSFGSLFATWSFQPVLYRCVNR